MVKKKISGYQFSYFDSDDEFIGVIQQYLDKKSTALIYACDARSLWISSSDEDLHSSYSSCNILISDGRPLYWIGKERSSIHLTGPKIFELLLNHSSFKNFSHYFIGGPEETLLKIEKYCFNRGLKNLYTHCPVFGKIEEMDLNFIVDDIDKKSPDFIWVGLGAPKQEILAHVISQRSTKGLFFGVGLAFDYLIDNVKKPPRFISIVGFEWLWRYAQQPMRVRRFIRPFFYVLKLLIIERVKAVKSL